MRLPPNRLRAQLCQMSGFVRSSARSIPLCRISGFLRFSAWPRQNIAGENSALASPPPHGAEVGERCMTHRQGGQSDVTAVADRQRLPTRQGAIFFGNDSCRYHTQYYKLSANGFSNRLAVNRGIICTRLISGLVP